MGTRSERYDAYYCIQCYVWIEERCSDESCYYCSSRPDRPSMNDLMEQDHTER